MPTPSWKRKLVLTAAVASLAGAIVLALPLSQFFTARRAPSGVETLVARAARNWEIPAAERRLKNPLLGDDAAWSQGRTLFEQHCMACHGVDGRGATAIGGGVSPRVPDLRGPATQALTDGELHYIITNGVKFTAMPALPSALSLSPEAGWQLTLYVRSIDGRGPQRGLSVPAVTAPGQLGPRDPLRLAARPTDRRALAQAQYVGSAACQRCHQDIYQRWQKSPMANIVRDPRTHPGLLPASYASNPVAPFQAGQVAFVYGSLWKQRFFTRVGNNYYALPVQWDVATKKWLPFHVPSTGADWWAHLYPNGNMQRPTGPTCDGCHSVGYNIATHQVAEWNVGCERCHGPGSVHVAHPKADNIVNPGSLGAVAETDTCVQCHSQGRPPTPVIGGQAYDWPVGYQAGLKLDDYWNLEPCSLGQTNFYYYPDCTAHKNRMQGNDFVQSVMYRHEITCTTCHDPHGSSNPSELVQPVNQLCLSCHSPGSPNGPREATVAAHTHHAAGSAGSQCIACHMPQIESEGVPGAGGSEMVHAHTFRFITPAMTDAYKIPNPCTTCHANQSAAWATLALRKWENRSLWSIP